MNYPPSDFFRVSLRTIALVGILTFASAGCGQTAHSNELSAEAFGSSFRAVPGTESTTSGDFNGDGLTDDFMLLDVDTKAVVDRDVTIIDPWNPGATDRVLGNIAIGMRLGCKNATQCPLVVFSDSDFFSSPIWSERPYPVAKVVSGTPEHEEWKARVQKLTADALRIGTEAGADILLYWDGKAFSLFWGAEEA